MVKGITFVLLILHAIGGLLQGTEVLAGHGIEVAVAGDISSVHRYAAIPQAAGAPLPGTNPALAVLHPMKGPATTSASMTSRVPAPAVLGQITITTGSAAVFERIVVQPAIATQPRPLNVPQFTIIQGTAALLDRATTGPNISARSQPLNVPQFTIIQGPAAVFDRATTGPNIASRSRPLAVPQFTIIQGTAALFDRRTTVANIAARSQPLAVQQFTIIQGTAAILERGLFDPLPPHATILSIGRGIHLQGTPDDSSGAFLRVNGLDHFVGQDGSFSFTVSTGALTVEIRAPGYLSVSVTSPSGPDLFVDSELCCAFRSFGWCTEMPTATA